ncbi:MULTISPECIES: penicillin-binding protein activator LpoB [Francisella]|uniref:Penicillin-binding protein activator LpoB n=1 Tax=Francisella opportunistica TaxID=2016517 RepID=A0A345JPY9_9GAMM|nr:MULTISPECIES: penicillin-binding protein activator LpoB [Francisella]APC91070.1 Putative periplasmic protein [Francisella sp. MA067296]AXH29385.1 penicillin-binding protein activator LpoB [Francisella opportunistica]AXH31036.1 penicillin-binding protein activator LpoB [Francisella opportunistica]AXH32683.1 penicillin-binding protein activator LpoB [Francisella opportunistica]
MQKRLITLLVSSVIFVTATAITAQHPLASTSMLSSASATMISASSMLNSASSIGYKGVDERNKLKMFRVAILPFDTKGAKIDGNIDQKQLQTGLNNSIIAQITQSRKFRVSNRDVNDEKAYEKEVKRILNSDTDNEKDKLNQKIGADFILTGDILNLNITKNKTTYYGEDFTTLNVSATVAYRMVELATMEVKWSNVVTIEVPTNIANQYANADDANYMQLLSYLGKQLGKTISDQVIGAIYPLQVLKVDDGEIYFNQGGNRVIKGSVYEVRQGGGVTLDPATGQHIVLDSKVLAKVRITDVMPKYSIGIVIDGSLAKVQPGLRAYLTK